MKDRLRRLIYRSTNRGCKETDYIFSDFAIHELKNLSASELDDYEELLEVDDNTLYAWFVGIYNVDKAHDTPVFSKIKVYNERKFKDL